MDRYDPPDIKQAVLFVTNNALVCETPDDAMKVAYELEPGQRYDAVALDGTFYQKSGIISGGSVDLARKVLIYFTYFPSSSSDDSNFCSGQALG